MFHDFSVSLGKQFFNLISLLNKYSSPQKARIPHLSTRWFDLVVQGHCLGNARPVNLPLKDFNFKFLIPWIIKFQGDWILNDRDNYGNAYFHRLNKMFKWLAFSSKILSISLHRNAYYAISKLQYLSNKGKYLKICFVFAKISQSVFYPDIQFIQCMHFNSDPVNFCGMSSNYGYRMHQEWHS